MIKQLENSEKDKGILLSYLLLVENDFMVPLSSKINLSDYVSKVLNLACVFVVIENDEILSCRIFYCNDLRSGIAYGSMMSTLPKAQGKGYARLLINKMIDFCRAKGFKSIISESVNPKAISLYKSIGYTVLKCDNEGRIDKVTLEFRLR